MRTAPYCSHSLHFSSSQTGRRAPPSISFWQRSAAGGWPGAFGSRCGVFCGTDPNTGTIPRSVLHAPPPTRRSGLFAPLPSHSSRHNRKLPSGGLHELTPDLVALTAIPALESTPRVPGQMPSAGLAFQCGRHFIPPDVLYFHFGCSKNQFQVSAESEIIAFITPADEAIPQSPVKLTGLPVVA